MSAGRDHALQIRAIGIRALEVHFTVPRPNSFVVAWRAGFGRGAIIALMKSRSPVKPFAPPPARPICDWRQPAVRGLPMTIILNHTIVPAHDKKAAAQFFARLFGLDADPTSGHFAPVRISDTLTLLFDDQEKFESHHYAFHVSDAEFDAILGRIREAKLTYGSAPWSLDDARLNDWNGGRGVYFRDPDGHVLELMTAPQ
jgi:catechol 2,3-dioxygenase-like lactoylglutathione lyase family enzyme